MNIKLKNDVLHNGKEFKSGDIISSKDMSKKEIERLIVIEAAEKTSESVPEQGAVKEMVPAVGDPDGLKTADEFMTDEEVFDEIDNNFVHAELKREAEELGMEFAANISKKDLIEKIIEEEKEDHFLDLVVDK